jgi:hypothetical protein
MAAQKGVSTLAALRQHWRKWTRTVERFARRQRGRRRVDPGEYQRVYQEVIGSCQSLAASASEADQVFYHELEELAQPWLSCQVLEKEDRAILLDLHDRCQQVEAELRARTGASRSWAWKRYLAAVAAGVGVVLGLLFLTADGAWSTLLGWLREAEKVTGSAIAKTTPTQQLIAGGIAVTVIAFWVVLKSVRGR